MNRQVVVLFNQQSIFSLFRIFIFLLIGKFFMSILGLILSKKIVRISSFFYGVNIEVTCSIDIYGYQPFLLGLIFTNAIFG